MLRYVAMFLRLSRILQNLKYRLDHRVGLAHLNFVCRVGYESDDATLGKCNELILKGQLYAIQRIPMCLSFPVPARAGWRIQHNQWHVAVPAPCLAYLVGALLVGVCSLIPAC